MRLDRAKTDAQVASDRFVRLARSGQLQDVRLARGQCPPSQAVGYALRSRRADVPEAPRNRFHRVDQFVQRTSGEYVSMHAGLDGAPDVRLTIVGRQCERPGFVGQLATRGQSGR